MPIGAVLKKCLKVLKRASGDNLESALERASSCDYEKVLEV